jgi:hypothetical protein
MLLGQNSYCQAQPIYEKIPTMIPRQESGLA